MSLKISTSYEVVFSASPLHAPRWPLFILLVKSPYAIRKSEILTLKNKKTMAQNFINSFKNQASAPKSPFVKARRSSNLGNPQMSLFTAEEIAQPQPEFTPTKPRFTHTWRDNNNMPTHYWQAVGMVDDGDGEECIYFEAENMEAAQHKAENLFNEQKIFPIHIFVYNMD